MKWLNGKKTWIGLVVVGLLRLLDNGTGFGLYDVPDAWHTMAETFFGVGLVHKAAKLVK